MLMLIDYDQVHPRLMAQFIALARRAARAGYAGGSTSEQIVAALLNGRVDWLPEYFRTPLEAIDRLSHGGAEWYHSMLAVHLRGWREEEAYEAEAV